MCHTHNQANSGGLATIAETIQPIVNNI